jgi:hypothetical protein
MVTVVVWHTRQVALSADEGYVSPLGFSEPSESRERPLYNGVEEGANGRTPGSGSLDSWQCRQHGKSTSQSEAELTAALNLL